jgi:hypothetical protein
VDHRLTVQDPFKSAAGGAERAMAAEVLGDHAVSMERADALLAA